MDTLLKTKMIQTWQLLHPLTYIRVDKCGDNLPIKFSTSKGILSPAFKPLLFMRDFYKTFCDCMKDVTPNQMLLHALNIYRFSCLLQISSVTHIYDPLLKEMGKLSAPYINTGSIWLLMAYCFFTKVRLDHKYSIAIISVVELVKSHFLAATEF